MSDNENLSPISSTTTPVLRQKEKGIGAIFFLCSLAICLAVGFGGGVKRGCDIAFDGKDDRAICYYRSAITNEPMFSDEDLGGANQPQVKEEVKDVQKQK